jgi:hypothetical protein|tara:strand:- start:14575 stop:14817 length:243 start_codon:yes stop_codon:yes gene_type:complete
MAKSKKITKEELALVSEKISQSTNFYAALGRSFAAVMKSLPQLDQVETELAEVQKDLQEKYGSISIDIATGEYTEQETAE